MKKFFILRNIISYFEKNINMRKGFLSLPADFNIKTLEAFHLLNKELYDIKVRETYWTFKNINLWSYWNLCELFINFSSIPTWNMFSIMSWDLDEFINYIFSKKSPCDRNQCQSCNMCWKSSKYVSFYPENQPDIYYFK